MNSRSIRARARALASLAAALLAAPALAQNNQGQLFTPNFRETDMQQIIQVVADATGRRIIASPTARGQPITFYNRDPLTADQLWDAFQQMLKVNSLVAVESSSGFWIITPEAQLRTEPSPIRPGTGAEVVTRYISVENVSAAQIVPIIRPMMSQSGQLGAVQGTNILLLVDRADNMRRLVDVVQAIDRSNSQTVDVVQLKYAAAEDVSQKLQAVIQAQTAGGLVGMQAIANERTNVVILTGTPSQIEKYRPIAEALDTPSTQGGGSTVRYLYYADAESVAMNLQSMFGGTQVVENAETASNPTGGNVNVIADTNTNSLIIRAPSVILQDMLDIVDSLDIPRAQVHIQAIIVEMSDSRAAELGLTWALDGAGGDTAAAVTNYSGTIGGILQLAQVGAGGTPDPGALGDGVKAAVGNLSDSGTSWAAVVSALEGDGQTNVMQLPELVVLDNEEATINVGQEVPFVTGQYTNAGGNAGGAVNPFQTTQREPVGTVLTITPRINEGTGMRLSIYQEVSSISSSAVASDVITNKRSIETAVFVNDGDILVLGGLIEDQLHENEQKVPGLGRIPGLKWLFRARKTDRSKTNLMVFIRPTILRDSAEATRMTTERYRALQDQQKERVEKPVPLLPKAVRPALPPLEDGNPDSSDNAPRADEIPPFDTPPSVGELRQGQR